MGPSKSAGLLLPDCRKLLHTFSWFQWSNTSLCSPVVYNGPADTPMIITGARWRIACKTARLGPLVIRGLRWGITHFSALDFSAPGPELNLCKFLAACNFSISFIRALALDLKLRFPFQRAPEIIESESTLLQTGNSTPAHRWAGGDFSPSSQICIVCGRCHDEGSRVV